MSASSAFPGAFAPTTSAAIALTPLPANRVSILSGGWADWQHDNRHKTAPHALEWLERDGTVDNLRAAAGADLLHRGPCFTDSDLYKAMEALAWEIGRSQAPELRAQLDDLITVVEDAQSDDGYINSYVQNGLAERWADLADGHELYCIGHLIQAGIADRRATGEQRLFAVATRAADLVVREFGTLGRAGVDGHEEIELALVELYRETHNPAYLELAMDFVDRRGHRTIMSSNHHDNDYYQDSVPPREQHDVVGHAVRAVYLLTALVDIAIETDDRELLAIAEAQWATIVDSKMYITGALGSRFDGESFGERYELPPDRAYGETCASIGHLMASWRLLVATGESKYADLIERSLYNLLGASTDVDRTAFFYNNPAQRRRALPAASSDVRPSRAEAPGTRPPWYETACCPPNVMRTVAALQSWVATSTASGVQVHQFMPARIDARDTAAAAQLEITTVYPDDGRVVVSVLDSADHPWELALRRPDWASSWRLLVNGERVEPRDELGYLRITRTWHTGDSLELIIDVVPRLTTFHPAADALRGTVAIERGPIVYCLEHLDQAAGTDLSELSVELDSPITEVRIAIGGVSTFALEAQGLLRDSTQWARGWREGLAASVEGRPVVLRLVPYYLWANRGPSVMRVHVPWELAPNPH